MKLVPTLVHPLSTATLGAVTAIVYLVYAISLLVRQLSPLSSMRFWTSEATNASVMAVAIIYILSHMLVLFERHFAWWLPSLHPQLVTRSTAVVGVSAMWFYSIAVACAPILINLYRGTVEQLHGYLVYLVVQFILVAVASALLMVSMIDCFWRGRSTTNNSSDITRTVTAFDKDFTRRCIVAMVVCAALWTPYVTFQLVDLLDGDEWRRWQSSDFLHCDSAGVATSRSLSRSSVTSHLLL